MSNGTFYFVAAIYAIFFAVVVIGIYELVAFIFRHLTIGWS
jgi:hypothetical protein